jgi:hypothetical protein
MKNSRSPIPFKCAPRPSPSCNSSFFPSFLLCLVIIIIGTLCYKMTRLTTLEAGVLSLDLFLLGYSLRPFKAVLKRVMMSAISSSLSPAASTCATLLGSASLLPVALRATGYGLWRGSGPFKASSTYLASFTIMHPLTNFPRISSGVFFVYLGFS